MSASESQVTQDQSSKSSGWGWGWIVPTPTKIMGAASSVLSFVYAPQIARFASDTLFPLAVETMVGMPECTYNPLNGNFWTTQNGVGCAEQVAFDHTQVMVQSEVYKWAPVIIPLATMALIKAGKPIAGVIAKSVKTGLAFFKPKGSEEDFDPTEELDIDRAASPSELN